MKKREKTNKCISSIKSNWLRKKEEIHQGPYPKKMAENLSKTKALRDPDRGQTKP